MTLIDIRDKVNKYQDFAPEYGDLNLTNHLPMAQYALYRLGANDADLERFTRRYIDAHGLHPAPVPSLPLSLNDANWREYLGKREQFVHYRSYFGSQLKKLGRTKFLELYFNALVRGISSEAYHSLIRLAYGVESENDEEIVSGVAYLADSYLELNGPLPEVSSSALPLSEQLSYLSEELSSDQLKLPPLEGIIVTKMSIISQADVLAGVSKNLAIPTGTTLRDFADLALNLYLTFKDFTALHTVTSCHASRVMMPYVEDKTLYLRYLYQAFVAAYLSIGAPQIANFESFPDSSQTIVEQLKAAAQKADDDHDIKLTYTSLEEHRQYGNNLYLKAALELYPELHQNTQ